MGTFIKKDFMLMLRDRKELILLVVMPFILTMILGFALGNWIQGSQSTPQLDIKVALADADDETEGKERFVRELQAAGLPAEMRAQLLAAAESHSPKQMLLGILQSESLLEMIKLERLDPQESGKALDKNKADAILAIPADFTYNTLIKMLLDRGDGAELELVTSASNEWKANVLLDILSGIASELNFQTALNWASEGAALKAGSESVAATVQGGLETVNQYKPVTSHQYFMFGMAVMFVLYVASNSALRALKEKRQLVYNRIIIAGTHPLKYLGGKAVSTTALAFVQLMVLFLLSSLVFQLFKGLTLQVLFGIAVTSAVLAICVGALSTVLTSLCYRMESDSVTDFFSGMFVALFAFLGGSFFPVSQMSDLLQTIGGWTPNGAALSSYLLAMQGAEAHVWMQPLYRLAIMAAVFFAAGVWIFPIRRDN
jgi:ABC-2 type transport system permease protein